MLNVPLASTVPSASSATANGLPGTSLARQASWWLTSSNVRRTTLGCAPKPSTAGCSARHSPQPSEVKTARPRRPRVSSGAKAGASALRAPTSGPSCEISSAPPCGTASRSIPSSRASASTTIASATSPSAVTARAIASQPSVVGSVRGSSGASASAAASAAARPADAVPMRPLLPKHPHGAPARPASERGELGNRGTGHQQGGEPRGRGAAGRDADAERQLDGDQRAPRGVLRARRVEAVRRQRGARLRAADELGSGGGDQHEPQEQAEHDRHHRRRRR